MNLQIINDTCCDAIVVGGGPAGSAAAYHLARLGRRVILLDRWQFPRDKSCGDGLSPDAIPLIQEMGVCPTTSPHFRQIDGIRIQMSQRGSRDFPYVARSDSLAGSGYVVSRFHFDRILSEGAERAGAVFWQNAHATALIFADGRVVGVTVRRDGKTVELSARWVVLAVGALSPLMRKLPCGDASDSFGYAVRAYCKSQAWLDDMFTFMVPLIDPHFRRALPGYGWINPMPDGLMNVGVGFYRVHARDRKVNLARVFEGFLNQLKSDHPQFSDLQRVGAPQGAPVPCGLTPERCAGPGYVLVGDAAGLVNPFTGEGITQALTSGKLAGIAVSAALAAGADETREMDVYRGQLNRLYGDAFQTGRSSVKIYQYLLNVLDASFASDRPSFVALRRSIHGFAEHQPAPSLAAPLGRAADASRQAFDLLRMEMTDVSAFDLPLLSRLLYNLWDVDGSFLRIHLLHLASRLGPTPVGCSNTVSKSIELAWIARGMYDDLPPCHATDSDREHWSDDYLLLTGDYLLASSYSCAAQAGAAACERMAAATGRVWHARIAWERPRDASRNDIDSHLQYMKDSRGEFFALSGALGGVLSNADDESVQAIRAFSLRAGCSYLLRRELRDCLAPVGDWREHPLKLAVESGVWPICCVFAEGAATDFLAARLDGAATLVDVQNRIIDSLAHERIAEVIRTMLGEAEQLVQSAPLAPIATELMDLCEALRREADAECTTAVGAGARK